MRTTSRPLARVHPWMADVVVKGERAFEVAGSTEAQDGHGEQIMVAGWDLTRFTGKRNGGVVKRGAGNPVILYGHDYSMPPVGRATSVVKDTGKARLVFDYELAQAEDYGGEWPARSPSPVQLAAMLASGYIRGHSVGFTPVKSEPMNPEDPPDAWWKPQRHLQQILNELSIVPIPSNPETLSKALHEGLLVRDHLAGLVHVACGFGSANPGTLPPGVVEAMLAELSAPKQFAPGFLADQTARLLGGGPAVPSPALIPRAPEARQVAQPEGAGLTLDREAIRALVREEVSKALGDEDDLNWAAAASSEDTPEDQDDEPPPTSPTRASRTLRALVGKIMATEQQED